MPNKPFNWSTIPYASRDENLPNSGQRHQRTFSARDSFEVNSCPYRAMQLAADEKTEAQRRREAEARTQRREAFMVKREQPKPVLKPSHSLARATDRNAFNTLWRQEQSEAHQHQLKQAYAAKRELEKIRNGFEHLENQQVAIEATTSSENIREGLRSMFKLQRRAEQQGKNLVQTKTRTERIIRQVDDR